MLLPHYGRKLSPKGYSHEDFKVGKTTIYKFTKDIKRRGFVRLQYKWLEFIKNNLPKYGFDELYYIAQDEETGYSMSIVDSQPMGKSNAKDLVKITKDVKSLTEKSDELKEFEIAQEQDSFEKYVEYVKKIVLKNPDTFYEFDWYTYEKRMLQYSDFANDNLSFHHGDFTVDNVLWDGNRYVIIDSNFKKEPWPSYLLDLSKLYQETRFSDSEFFEELKKEIKKQYDFDDIYMEFIELLEVSHYIRMIPYVKKHQDIYNLKMERFNNLPIK